MEKKGSILVLDFGGQYTHLIARRVRELGVYAEIVPPTLETKKLRKAKGLILSGGPYSVYDKDAPKFNQQIFEIKKPLLGLCYGHQLIAQQLGGKVHPGKTREYGKAELIPDRKSILFGGLGRTEIVWMSHGDRIEAMPLGFRKVGSTFDCDIAAMEHPKMKIYGLQFHPEVTHTESGMRIFKNFVFRVCRARRNWGIAAFMRDEIKLLKRMVGSRNVFILISGGIDSTVCAALLAKAVRKQKIHAVHVNTGFMRKNESRQVVETLGRIGIDVRLLDVSAKLFRKLEGVCDPEEKRKIIGDFFVEVSNKELKKMGVNPDEWLICQGTIYPDTIETGGTKYSSKIKTHHNRVESMRELIEKGRVIEPISQLYKDEVRAVGEKLGLPHEIVWRHPFPGPGLAIRILCSRGGKIRELEKQEAMAQEIAQSFGFRARALPVKAVGVQGDFRTYKNAVALEGSMDWGRLEECSSRITNEVGEFNRVVYNCGEALGLIEAKKCSLNQKRVKLLQEADAIAMEEIRKAGLERAIWQFPVVLLPLDVNKKGAAIVLRPVSSREAMTARFFPMDKPLLDRIVARILAIKGISAVFYDITHKPPATIEWE